MVGHYFNGAALPRKYLSLGGWCGPALILGKLGLRTEAYPFDFSRCTLDGIIHFIKHGFREGFYPPGLKPYQPECVGPWVLYRGQHTAFAHFDLNDPKVQQNFERRFERFHRLLDGLPVCDSGPVRQRGVTFFRTVTAVNPRDELALAPVLEQTLKKRNPHLDFRVVFIVHDQGLKARSVQLVPLSPCMTLWTLGYTEDSSHSLFDRSQKAYTDIVTHSVDNAAWSMPGHDGAFQPVGYRDVECDLTQRLMLSDSVLRIQPISFDDLTADRFPWRCHKNLALINGVASVGGTCTGVGSTRMLHDFQFDRLPKCAYCGSKDFHRARRPFSSEKCFTAEEDQIIMLHIYRILTGEDKVETVEHLAHELNRGAYEVICRIQFLTNSSTKLINYLDAERV